MRPEFLTLKPGQYNVPEELATIQEPGSNFKPSGTVAVPPGVDVEDDTDSTADEK